MKQFAELAKAFSILFSYPTENSQPALAQVYELLPRTERERLIPFTNYCERASLSEVEELFTQTFDMNPATCLEIGWHLFGEDYKRGQFLVYMRQSLADYKIKESIELPDHFSHCLQLIALLDYDDTKTFAETYLIKPLHKIIDQLPEHNPYCSLMTVMVSLLKEQFKISELNTKTPEGTGVFKKNQV